MRGTSVLGVLLSTVVLVTVAGGAGIKRINANANPPAYAAFSRMLNGDDRIVHALDRLTFGARPEDSDALNRTGLNRWIELQLNPDRVAEDPVLTERLRVLDASQPTADDRAAAKIIADKLAQEKLLRAIYSNRQLEELLVDFWFNHFNVNLNKGRDRYFTAAYEREAIRPYVFAKFYDLLLATAKSPAMLFYLDNWQSVAPRPTRANATPKRGLNENYGRELLELHTLGVDGGYTQQDVIEVARCFTGWTITKGRPLSQSATAASDDGQFAYNDKVHDKGQKLVLGHVIPAGGGMNDGLMVLDILAHHPSTARFISLKLAQRFVADDPPPSLVNRMAETFLKTHGDLRQVMRIMLDSGEFWSEGAYRAKVKTPLEIVASAARATGAQIDSADALAREVQRLGEPLYRKVEPTGYSTASADWVSSAGLLERMNFAVALAHNRVPGVTVSAADWERLGAPEFQRH